MIGYLQNKRTLAMFLGLLLLLSTLGSLSVDAQRRSRRYRRPHHSRLKGALIGAGVGTVGGAVIGGGKGAVIGAGAGAGTGYLIQRHRNRRHRHYRRP
ncbi:MAG TPA: YMGG-like glycine zipper-containing protein [Pyrinomonadaceae bacterium]|nr:YMGG-like glycine zipper-containing protein [Pyrinomonadaceae bacterium]